MTIGLVSLLTFFVGLLLGNWLAIGRDKRKEFNEAAAPIRGWLIGEKDAPGPHGNRPSNQEVDRFVHYLWRCKRSSFLAHLSTYRALDHAMTVHNSFGEISYSDDKEIRRELAKLFNYTRLR